MIAVENMANAIKQISVQRGYDVTQYTLACFGGAGGQHACLVADALGMHRVFVHPFAGVLSAYGMGLADVRAVRQKAVEAAINEATVKQCLLDYQDLDREAVEEILDQGISADRIDIRRSLHIKYDGTDSTLEVAFFPDAAAIEAGFAREYRARYGFLVSGRPLVVEAIAVEAIGRLQDAAEEVWPLPERASPHPTPVDVVHIFTGSRWRMSNVYARDDMAPGARIDGPAVIMEKNATTVIEPGWQVELSQRNHLVLQRTVSLQRAKPVGTNADPVMLEVFNNLFMSIAEQMGVTLANTSSSVNIKERLDFSCAIFDIEGQLIANAPHMPVHLGSMGDSVQIIMKRRAGTMLPTDVYVLNAPYAGGTHLPDVTVVMPVFLPGYPMPMFYVASRGHHADIGGVSPGSMPANSTHVDQEGLLIDNVQLVAGGVSSRRKCALSSAAGPYPARNIEQNLADLRAQVASCAKGAEELVRMVEQFGLDVVCAYMRHVQDNAEESVRRVIGSLRDGRFEYEMDCGARIAVSHHDRYRRTRGDHRLHGHQRAAAKQLQCPFFDLQGSGDVRIPHFGRRRYPDERGVLAPLEDRDPGGKHAQSALPRRRGRGQCRDIADDHRLPLRRARRDGSGTRHDEQLHLRQR